MHQGSKITVYGCGSPGEHSGDTAGGLYARKGICKNLASITDNKDLIPGVGGKGTLDWVTFKPMHGGAGGGILKIECQKLIMHDMALLSANGKGSVNGAGSGGIIWLKCFSFENSGNGYICCKGGKPNGDHGRVRIDTVSQDVKADILKCVQCNNICFGKDWIWIMIQFCKLIHMHDICSTVISCKQGLSNFIFN